MKLILVICLLALTGSAFSASTYGSGYGSSLPQPATPIITVPRVAGGYEQEFAAGGRSESHRMEEQQISGSFIKATLPAPVEQSYGAPLTVPKTLPVETYATASQDAYGSGSYAPQTVLRTLTPVLTEADILCQGQPAETIIPIDNNRKFVVCIDTGKGTQQECPKGLWFHPVSRRCERTLGPLEDACASQPCLFGGQCLTAGSSYQCQCAPGYDGVNCELDARVCQTQQPCGSYAKCQSFRAGAALSHICIFQDGLTYGFNAQQTFQSPCSTVSGPYALAASNGGFIMCDSERMFIESCPGGTIWDDVDKACSWPDQKVVLDDIPRDYSSSYAPALVAPKLVQSYGPAPAAPRILDSYAPAPVAPKFVQSYGPAPAAPRILNSYAPALVAPKLVQSYGPAPAAPRIVDSYAPAPVAPKFIQSYGTAPVPPRIVESYGAAPATPFVAPKVLDSYASVPAAPRMLDSYAPAPAAPKIIGLYGAEISTPRQLLTKILAKQSSGY